MVMGHDQSWSTQFEIKKLDDEKRLATVIVSVVTKADGTPITDLQGDIIEIDELESAFIEAFADGGMRKGGEMHAKIGGADVVQHFTLSKAERVALGFGDGEEMGIAKLRVNDDSLWQKIKTAQLPAISIAGTADREPA